jgi:hypothetical protein
MRNTMIDISEALVRQQLDALSEIVVGRAFLQGLRRSAAEFADTGDWTAVLNYPQLLAGKKILVNGRYLFTMDSSGRVSSI